MPPDPYRSALGRAERGRYEVPGATVPWLLTPIAAPVVRGRQSLRIAGQRWARRRNAALHWRRKTESSLPDVDFGDVILLRSFGNDGGITVASQDGSPEPLEGLIYRVAVELGYRDVYALSYRAAKRIPRGPRYCTVGDERWKTELGAALSACSAIVVVLHDSTEFRPGFAHELKEIRESPALSAKTVLVGASLPSAAAYDVMIETLRHLGWPEPASVPIACLRMSDGRLAAYVAEEDRDDEQREYVRAITVCLRHTPDFPAIFGGSGT